MSLPVNTGAKARHAALVIAGAMIIWLGAQAAGPRFGWGPVPALFFDFAALAAFVWALVMTYQIWRARRDD